MKEFVEKLIGRLEERRNEENNNSLCEMNENGHTLDFECSVGKTNAFNESISIVNELAEEYNNSWIPCVKTLPETYEYVLVWCKGRFIDGTWVGEECEWYGIGVMYGNKWTVYQCKDIRDIEVLAWQPLPAPYRSEKEEWKDNVMGHFINVE